MAEDRTDKYYSAEGGTIGYGAQVLMGDGGSPQEFEAIFGIRTITMGQTTVADTDMTHLRSPDAHREHAPGMLDTTPIEFGGIYKHNEWSLSETGGGSGAFAQGGLPKLSRERGIHDFRVRLPMGSPEAEVDVRGYLTGFSISEINQEGVIEWTCGLMPTQAYRLP